MMRRLPAATTAAAIVALAVPATVLATEYEIGNTDGPQPAPACPATPCFAISRTTGYQAKVGTKRGLMTIPADGRIVAWSITLGKPGKKQIAFFNQKLGGAASAQITILNPRSKLRSRAVAQGEPQQLEPYFGSTVEFALQKSIPVKKGWVVALSTTTWVPALAVNLGVDTSWRASRGRGTCDDTQSQTAQTQPNQLTQYYCLYRTARLMYTATLITNPTPTNGTTTPTTPTTTTPTTTTPTTTPTTTTPSK